MSYVTESKPKGESTQYVADALREMIFSGALEPGQPLRQSKLAEQLGTSRIPLREAFHQLAAEGLIMLQTNRGAIVSGITAHEIQQYQEMRARLETWLLELAMPVMTGNDLEKAEAYLEVMDTCSDEDWSNANLDFHCSLYVPANRDLIVQTVRKVYHASYRRFQLPILTTRNREKSRREHQELLELCRKREVQAVLDRLEAHILMNGRAVLDHVRALEARRAQD